jgi:hypothetical protein
MRSMNGRSPAGSQPSPLRVTHNISQWVLI